MQEKYILTRAILVTLAGFMAQVAFVSHEAEGNASGQVHYAKGSQQSFQGPAENFTGDVKVDMVFPGNNTAHYSAAYVTFQPSARTAWHAHPAGQHMVIVSGAGLTGTRDGNVIEFSEGETVWCPPGIDHWHGATRDKAMTHLVITGSKDGKNVIWKEKVTDDQIAANY